MKRNVMIDELLSAINTDTDENKYDTAMLKRLFFITSNPNPDKLENQKSLPAAGRRSTKYETNPNAKKTCSKPSV